MIDYTKAKLYTIRSFQTEDIYIGSTVQSLSERMRGHREHYQQFLKGKYHYVSSFDILKYPDCYIELLKDIPCENKEQMRKLEGQEIRNNKCVNKRIEGRTIKEWINDNIEILNKKRQIYRDTHKDYMKAYSEKYRLKNKEKLKTSKTQYYIDNKNTIKAKNSTPFHCECGSIIQKCQLSRHKKTEKHLTYINGKSQRHLL